MVGHHPRYAPQDEIRDIDAPAGIVRFGGDLATLALSGARRARGRIAHVTGHEGGAEDRPDASPEAPCAARPSTGAPAAPARSSAAPAGLMGSGKDRRGSRPKGRGLSADVAHAQARRRTRAAAWAERLSPRGSRSASSATSRQLRGPTSAAVSTRRAKSTAWRPRARSAARQICSSVSRSMSAKSYARLRIPPRSRGVGGNRVAMPPPLATNVDEDRGELPRSTTRPAK